MVTSCDSQLLHSTHSHWIQFMNKNKIADEEDKTTTKTIYSLWWRWTKVEHNVLGCDNHIRLILLFVLCLSHTTISNHSNFSWGIQLPIYSQTPKYLRYIDLVNMKNRCKCRTHCHSPLESVCCCCFSFIFVSSTVALHAESYTKNEWVVHSQSY